VLPDRRAKCIGSGLHRQDGKASISLPAPATWADGNVGLRSSGGRISPAYLNRRTSSSPYSVRDSESLRTARVRGHQLEPQLCAGIVAPDAEVDRRDYKLPPQPASGTSLSDKIAEINSPSGRYARWICCNVNARRRICQTCGSKSGRSTLMAPQPRDCLRPGDPFWCGENSPAPRSGDRQRGSFSLNDVLSTIGTPVKRKNASIKEGWRNCAAGPATRLRDCH
jgi:hypothetical protein